MSSTDDSERYGERLYPCTIDERARDGYARPFAMFSKTPNPSDGLETVSYQRLANAVNRVCWWLDAGFPGREERDNAFAYFGPNDLRYIIFFFATWKTGRKVSQEASLWNSETFLMPCRSSSPLIGILSKSNYHSSKGSIAKALFRARPKIRLCNIYSMLYLTFAKSMHLL
jgi:acyl-coenzyme A synthetase/AMP-(fatty) acid ligase